VFVADRIRIRRVSLAGDAAHVTDLFDRPTRGEGGMRAGWPPNAWIWVFSSIKSTVTPPGHRDESTSDYRQHISP
jgi:hypothetical protein